MRLIDADALTDFLKCLFPARGMWEIEGDTAKDAICETVVEAMEMVKNMETIKPEQPPEIQDILNYLDTVLHPIISPEHWDVYSELHDMISSLPSAKPKTCEGCKHFGKWENEVEYGCSSPCTFCKRRVADNYEKESV